MIHLPVRGNIKTPHVNWFHLSSDPLILVFYCTLVDAVSRHHGFFFPTMLVSDVWRRTPRPTTDRGFLVSSRTGSNCSWKMLATCPATVKQCTLPDALNGGGFFFYRAPDKVQSSEPAAKSSGNTLSSLSFHFRPVGDGWCLAASAKCVCRLLPWLTKMTRSLCILLQ